ncbi:MAG TPA: 16S rRNA (cytosine(1402)-N(4))-methyltransferase RsmH [Candidatus Stackebrandtia faecavium]|nr:16S rRNA (cytosine(1402)-N(4))-methyltransferase RsmH [Candidatus Stackebrandtia faecavium]
MMQHEMPRQAHVPVFLDRVIQLLTPALRHESAVCVDATLGAGGHTEALLTSLPHLTVVGIDRDRYALELAQRRLEPFGSRFIPAHAVYDEIGEVLADLDITAVSGVLFDLGVSSMQLDIAERGFAYAQDGPLDMRMDQSRDFTAYDVVNTYAQKDLERILKRYGEERFANRIARRILSDREKAPISTSRQLADLVKESVPAATRRTGGNPAKRTFQALRIEVNRELDVLERALPAARNVMAPHGRIVVLSYHSLEDRIVKRDFAESSTSSSPPGLPMDLPGTEPTTRLVTKGAQPPDAEEIEENPRAASAKLRAIEKLPDHNRHS